MAALLLLAGCPGGKEKSPKSVSPVSSTPSAGGLEPGLADRINAYLSQKNARLAGTGADFVAEAKTYGVDPRLPVAMSGAESSFGNHVCDSEHFNAWNWFWCYATNTCEGNPCKNSPFPSWKQGITTVTKFLRRSYINKGYDSIPLIGAKYCKEGCQFWVGNVTKFYRDDLGGDPGHLSFAAAESGTGATPRKPTPRRTP